MKNGSDNTLTLDQLILRLLSDRAYVLSGGFYEVLFNKQPLGLLSGKALFFKVNPSTSTVSGVFPINGKTLYTDILNRNLKHNIRVVA